MPSQKNELLFSYGTLQLEKVQLASFGRKLSGTRDVIKGFKLEQLKITDKEVLQKSGKEFHPIAMETGKLADQVDGMIFEITPQELQQADYYEVADYKRIKRTFKSGKEAWIYVQA